MTLRAGFLALLVGVLVGLAAFYLVAARIGGPWFGLANDADALSLLESSQRDLKRLAVADPARAGEYHERFEEIQLLANRMRILAHNRELIGRRYRAVLLGAVGGALVLAGAVFALGQRRERRRLERLGRALEELAAGKTDVTVGERGSGAIGAIGAMIERTSRTMARDRQRVASLTNLAAWQEAARRQAHELRTPLAAARLGIDRVDDLAGAGGTTSAGIRHAVEEVRRDLEQLGTLTQQFAALAKVPAPRLADADLGDVVREFVDGFAGAWSNVRLDFVAPDGPLEVSVDRDMLRQVLVNLCENSAQALGSRPGRVTLAARRVTHVPGFVGVDVADDGPGVPESIRARLFEPYATTRKVGEGMGLGLAISRKILLDHGGDLELTEASPAGTAFRLLLPDKGRR